MKPTNRREFIRRTAAAAAVLSTGSSGILLAAQEREEQKNQMLAGKYGPNDTLRIACIGVGIMGHQNIETALKVPGVKLVAVCDLYTGRLERAKEKFGKDLFVTRDYQEILNRKDIDAVIIATSDHYHARITMDALKAGKHVYCEKPMVQKFEEGQEVIETWKNSGKVMQVGSQRVSSIALWKAKEMFKAGILGQLNSVEASFDRQDALGAWEYTMPLDASEQTVDWKRYIAGLPPRPFDPKQFFWWRNYREFGTGVSGDLFVHLLSGIHLITGSYGPVKIFSSGQLCYWKDGRDVPDVMMALMEYPETPEHPQFQVTLRVNFVSGAGEKGITRLIGSEGVMELGWNDFTVTHSIMSKAPGIGGWDAFDTYPEAMQKKLMEEYNRKYSAEDQKRPEKPPFVFKAPDGYDEHLDHFTNFFHAVRGGKPVVEDAEFGFRAAAPCLACNESYFRNKIIRWDPVNMKLV